MAKRLLLRVAVEGSVQPSRKNAWLGWGIAAAAIFAYVALGISAGHDPAAKLELTPEARLDLTLFRLADDSLQFALFFKGKGHERRLELGEWADLRAASLMKFAHPGADVRIRASSSTSASVVYQAMPTSGYARDINIREMTTNLSVEPGVWREAPSPFPPSLPLFFGVNKVTLEVTTVEPPLVGEIIELQVSPPIQLKSVRKGFVFLVPGVLLWPLFVLSQTVWLLSLVWIDYARRRTMRKAP